MSSERSNTPNLLAAVLMRCAEEEGGVRALARALGISPQTLHDLIAGRRRPGKHVSSVIAGYLRGAEPVEGTVTADIVRGWSSQAS